jgi:hypothetical protein
MLRLVIEYGLQRRKFDLINPIDIGLVGNEIKSIFNIEDRNNNEYHQLFLNVYIDLLLIQPITNIEMKDNSNGISFNQQRTNFNQKNR